MRAHASASLSQPSSPDAFSFAIKRSGRLHVTTQAWSSSFKTSITLSAIQAFARLCTHASCLTIIWVVCELELIWGERRTTLELVAGQSHGTNRKSITPMDIFESYNFVNEPSARLKISGLASRFTGKICILCFIKRHWISKLRLNRDTPKNLNNHHLIQAVRSRAKLGATYATTAS